MLYRKLNYKSVTLALFVLLVFLFLSMMLIEIQCPIYKSLTSTDTIIDSGVLKISDVNAELMHYDYYHNWCLHSFLTMTWKVTATVENGSSDTKSSYILLRGSIEHQDTNEYGEPRPSILTEALVVENSQLVHIKVPPSSIEELSEMVTLEMVGGRGASAESIPQIHFTPITDYEAIIASCPMCGGDKKVSLIKWIGELTK